MWAACSYPLRERNYKVRVMDNLMYGGRGLIPCLINKNFEFMRGDVRDASAMEAALQGVDLVIHLAAIVGYPACKNTRNWRRRSTSRRPSFSHKHEAKIFQFCSVRLAVTMVRSLEKSAPKKRLSTPCLFTVRQKQKPRSCCWIVVMSSATASPRLSVHPTGCASTCL